MKPSNIIRSIRLIHTLIWVFFAGCIAAIPLYSRAGRFYVSFVLIGVVFIECLVIVFNRGRCPLTDVAARYTEDRRENFDIYLPVWLAKYNKLIFGTLFVFGALYTLYKWLVVSGR